jgi:hypothetical protein
MVDGFVSAFAQTREPAAPTALGAARRLARADLRTRLCARRGLWQRHDDLATRRNLGSPQLRAGTCSVGVRDAHGVHR